MGKIVFSSHAKKRLLQRGLNEDTVLEIIGKPEYVIKSYLNRKIAVKRIGNELWHVVYLEKENIIKVITVYYE